MNNSATHNSKMTDAEKHELNRFSYVKCSKCNWVHFTVTKSYVQQWILDWQTLWPTLDTAAKNSYGLPNGPPDASEYFRCNVCGESYKNFERALTAPLGSTVGPILEASQEWP